jgi:hypothetical protein
MADTSASRLAAARVPGFQQFAASRRDVPATDDPFQRTLSEKRRHFRQPFGFFHD